MAAQIRTRALVCSCIVDAVGGCSGCTLLSQSYTCSCLRFHKKKVQKQAKAVLRSTQSCVE